MNRVFTLLLAMAFGALIGGCMHSQDKSSMGDPAGPTNANVNTSSQHAPDATPTK